jgi:hypothetical protein
MSNSFKVIRGQSWGESRELEEPLNLVDFKFNVKLNSTINKSD